jgi:Uma2 family endonuclease
MVMKINSPVWTISDLEGLPDHGNRYEIISGELFVTRAPHFEHQDLASAICAELRGWCRQTNLGKAVVAPGIVWSDTDAVIPDVVWATNQKVATCLDGSGHFTQSPELIIEILSRSSQDRQRDRQTKLKLYSSRGVLEYWIVDPQERLFEIYRRVDGLLELAVTLYSSDTLTSPLLPGFSCAIAIVFE